MRHLLRCVFYIFLLLMSDQVFQETSAELISLAVVAGTSLLGGTLVYNYNEIKCRYYECCNDERWMAANFDALKKSLESKLYGQPLVMDTVIRSVRAHWTNSNPTKALVLSFHGWTGCGKNYVSSLIVDALYKRGMHSNFVHLYLTTLHFPHQEDSYARLYADNLRNWIISNITLCERSIFIFDEVDKMNPIVLEGVKPFIDHHEHVQGVDFRKSIFIFLSNTGAQDIAEHTLSYESSVMSLWDRGSMKLVDVEKLIHTAAYNEEGGLRFSALIEHNLIDHFIPFLPLQREHVKLCIKDYMISHSIRPTPERINAAADQLQYFPADTKLYSKSGCKRVPHKVDLIVQEEYERNYEASKRSTIEL